MPPIPPPFNVCEAILIQQPTMGRLMGRSKRNDCKCRDREKSSHLAATTRNLMPCLGISESPVSVAHWKSLHIFPLLIFLFRFSKPLDRRREERKRKTQRKKKKRKKKFKGQFWCQRTSGSSTRKSKNEASSLCSPAMIEVDLVGNANRSSSTFGGARFPPFPVSKVSPKAES